MAPRTLQQLADLCEADETAWMEAAAELVRRGQFDEIDTASLAKYLTDMSKRDRREVESRLIVLIAPLLKWTRQPTQRSGSWRTAIIEQRQELDGLVGQGVLRNHAEAVLAAAHAKAVERSAAETGLDAAGFSQDCPYTLDDLLSA
ncbi:MAG: DUF29 domain-containing protein [Gemmataceae bacterium]|nr:DUF29 domain-containing protein [Gemmataceae bacterium]